jgi:hypothetical protein
MIWINATYFCCGANINDKGIVTEAAPIIAWSRGKHYNKILEFLRNRNALTAYKLLDKQ